MSEGNIFVAQGQGVYVLKFEGDVRLTLCSALNAFLEELFKKPDLEAVYIDLCDAKAIDSTTLGFIAKIAILSQRYLGKRPVLISVNPDIDRLLVSVGFDQVFDLVAERFEQLDDSQALQEMDASEEEVKERVLEAHRILIELNEENRAKFEDLVETLEKC